MIFLKVWASSVKIVLLLNSDIHCRAALALLSESLKNHQVKIILSQKVGNVSDLPPEIIAMQKLEKCDFAQDFSSYQNINSPEAFEDLQKFSPDLFISIRFGQILKNPDLIRLPRFGIINLHSGILPNYRGVMASFWAILNGEKNLGMTLHYITDSGIDTGAIIGFSKSEIDWNSPLIKNISALYIDGIQLLAQVLNKISVGEKIDVTDQKILGVGQYFSYPKSEDVQRFSSLMSLV